MLFIIPKLDLIIVTILEWNINEDKMLENKMMIFNVICDLVSANEMSIE